MVTDKIRKYVIPNIPYLFILWAFLKLGTAYRIAGGASFGTKLLGTLQTIGPAFETIAPGLSGLDWLVGICGAALFRFIIYSKVKKANNSERTWSMARRVGLPARIVRGWG